MSKARPETDGQPGTEPETCPPAGAPRSRRAPSARRCQPLLAAGCALVLGVVLSACASDYSYLSHDASGLYFRVPESWTALTVPDDGTETSTVSYLRVLDGADEPDLAHLDAVGDTPVGVVQVLDLTPSQRDTLSLSALRELSTNGDGDPFDLQEDPESGLRVLRYRDLEVEGGYRGNRIAFSRVEEESGATVVTEQIALLAPNSDRIYQLVIHCSQQCFETRKGEIDVVLDSWNVRA